MAVLLTLSGQAFSTDSNAIIKPKWSDINPAAKECDGFSDDSLILTININKNIIKHEFCSSYGKAKANIIKDSRGVNFLILKTALGRGTHVTTEYLTVYRIEKYLEELTRFPVYEPAGRFANCYFDYKIAKPKDGGLLFSITVRIEDNTTEDSAWIPTEKERTILIK